MRVYNDLEQHFINHICTDYNILAFIMKKFNLNDFEDNYKHRINTINHLFKFSNESNEDKWEVVFKTNRDEFKNAYIEMKGQNIETI